MYTENDDLSRLITYAAVGVGMLVVAALVFAILTHIIPGDVFGIDQFRPREELVIPGRPVPQTLEEKRALLNEVSAYSQEGQNMTFEQKQEVLQELEIANEEGQTRPLEEDRLLILETLKEAE